MLRFFLFMAGLMATCTSTAGGKCSVDTVPIQITNGTRQDSVTTLSAARISDSNPHFRAFVTAVTEHVADRLAQENLCTDNTDSKEQSLLQFVNWPLTVSENKPLAPMPSLDIQASGGCRISSPWIDIAFERGPVPSVRGVVRWNDRQLLADQAVLEGARNVPTGLPTPFLVSEFRHFAHYYADSEILGKPVVEPVEERIPPDILWLFRHSWQSTRAPFVSEASNSMEIALEKGAEGYTKLVNSLIDRCFDSGKANIQYDFILDVTDLISLEQYKINTLTY